MTSPNHFTTGAADYAAYRPGYPVELVNALAALAPGHRRALDCGCGTGQLSVLLADRFDEVVATDASAAQIEQAEAHPRVIYRTAPAEASGLPEHSVDLVTVAQAAHWLDLDRFYAEVRRVGRPGAAIALITYGVLHVEGPADPLVQHFYNDVIGPYWPPERRHVEDGYRHLAFPFREVAMPALAMEASWTLDELLGYFGTWSAVRAAHKALGTDPVAAFADELRQAWGDARLRRKVSWPLSLRAGLLEAGSTA